MIYAQVGEDSDIYAHHSNNLWCVHVIFRKPGGYKPVMECNGMEFKHTNLHDYLDTLDRLSDIGYNIPEYAYNRAARMDKPKDSG